MKLTVVMPVFNEFPTLNKIVDQVLSVEVDAEVDLVIVDDYSTDGTRDLLKELENHPQITVLYHDRNRGKGAALQTGIPQASGDYVIIQDADLEYDPKDYNRMLRPVKEGRAQVVYGSRFTGERLNLFFHHWLGNRFLTLMTNILYNTTLSDMETCYKLWRRDIIQGLTIKSDRFDFEPEVTAKVLKKGIRIYEVPITYMGREYSEGKKITWVDGIAALWTLVKYRFVD